MRRDALPEGTPNPRTSGVCALNVRPASRWLARHRWWQRDPVRARE
jgi:hypothetical protein